MPRPRLIVPLAATLTAALLAAAPAQAATRSFKTPSRQIGCLVSIGARAADTFVRCDPLFLNDRAYTVSASGRGRAIRISDTVFDPQAPVLAYGRRVRLGPFTCVSRQTGLTCRNRRHHGFVISRQRRRTF
jgi:hypothetical protein